MKKTLIFCILILGFIVTTAMQKDDGADITFDTTLHNFGIIRQGSSVRYEFKFKNTGNQPLILTSGTAPCLCVKVDGSREPIMPGGKGIVKVTYDATSAGNFMQPLTITSNAINKHGSITLHVKGTVKSK